jgi:hypothetical protein
MNRINFLLCLFALMFAPLLVQANHLYSGHISYTADPQNPRKIDFVMTLYLNAWSPADEPAVLSIDMGDGVRVNAERTSATYYYNRHYRKYVYQWSYTYPSSGKFHAGWNAENRNGGIVNISSDSDTFSAYIFASLTINPLTQNLSGPQIAGEPLFEIYAGEPWKYNLLAYDLDGDELMYELVAPAYKNPQGVIASIPGYQVPEGLTIDRFGELKWDNPTQKGQYAIAVKITEKRRGHPHSYTIVDMTINVTERTVQPQFSLLNQGDLSINDDGSIQAWPDQPVKLEYYLRKNPNSNLSLSARSYGELDTLNLADATLSVRDTTDGLAVTYTFTPTQAMERATPYLIGVRGEVSDKQALPTDTKLEFGWAFTYFFVGAERPAESEPPLSSGDSSSPEMPKLYPNPARGEFTIEAPDLPGLHLLVRDITGKVVARYALKPGRNEFIRPAKLASGLYTYTLTSQLSPIKTGKLVLQ